MHNGMTFLKARSRIWIETDEGTFLGEGTVRLLKSIEKTGSILASSKELGMSYRKAWRLIDRMNKQCQSPMVIKTSGGTSGGGSTLTESGKRVIASFEKLQKETAQFVDDKFKELNFSEKKLNDVTGLILIGGRSSRMGIDKASLYLEEESFTSMIYKKLNSLLAETFVVAGEHNATNWKQKLPVVQDKISDQGPLMGLYSGLSSSTTEWVFVTSVDTPLVSTEMIEELYNERSGYEAVIYHDSGRLHPLCGLYHRSCFNRIEETMSEGQRSMKKFVNRLKVKILDVGLNEKRLFNINTPEDYKSLQNSVHHAKD
jgi:molybdate transport system regulatory protein